MTLPNQPTNMTMTMVAAEIGATPPLSLGDSRVRTLAGKPTGAVSMSDLRGKSAYTPPTAFIAGPLARHEFAQPGETVECSVAGSLTITNGEAPFNVSWARTSGNASVSVNGTLSPLFSTSGTANYIRTADFQATVTDNRGSTTTASVSVTLSGGNNIS